MKILIDYEDATKVHQKLHDLGLHHHAPEVDIIDDTLVAKNQVEFETNESPEAIQEALGKFSIKIKRGWL